MADFDIFVPHQLPHNLSDAQFYGIAEIQRLAARFDLEPVKTSKEWSYLLTSFITSNFLCDHKVKKSWFFWPEALKNPNGDLRWSENIRKLMEIILTLPAGSAKTERAFSIMKHAKYDGRSSLTVNTMDDK